MSRPFIICHMLTSLDGKITGDYMNSAAIAGAEAEYERVNESFNPDAFLCGRVTTEENFTKGRKPDVDECAPTVPEGDYVAVTDASIYYVSVDPSGKVGWNSNTLNYAERPAAHVIEVLTEKASNAYRAFLRGLKISYIIAGDERLDCALTAEKLNRLFGIGTLMLSGGGTINWSFLEAGIVDELSLILAPLADGATDTPTLFDRRGEGSTVAFNLKATRRGAGDSLWLRYDVINLA